MNTIRRRLFGPSFRAGLVWVLSGFLFTAAGQTDLTELSIEQLASAKVDVVYGASQHEQSLAEAPSDVTIITAEEIKQSGYRTLAEILNGVRGFYTTSDGVYDYVGTRGFNRPGDYGGRILITVDGHRMNDDLFDSAAIGTDFIVDVDLIERVEVIRGPGSSLYGDNAVLAVVNVITRRGRDVNGGEIAVSYGSYNEGTGRFSYGNRLTNGVEFALSGTYLGRGGDDKVYYPTFANINGGYANNYQSASDPSGFASISYKDISLETGLSQRTEIAPNGAYNSTFNDADDKIVDQRGFVDLKLQHQFDNDLEFMSRVYYDHYRYDGNYPLAQFPAGAPLYPGAITLNLDRDDQESLGAELRLSKTVLQHHRLTAGAEYRHDLVLEQRNFNLGGPVYLNSNPTEDTVGIYGQDEYTIVHNLLLNAGARYDYFSYCGGTFNPRAALIYTPRTNSTVKAIYGEAFRAPDAFERFYEAPGYDSASHLKPETIHSYELDFDQVMTPHLQLAASVFYYHIDNLITFATTPSGESIFGNLDQANSAGGEIELDGNWGRGWRGNVSYTYADTRDSSTGQRLTDSPANVAKLHLTAPVWREKVTANLELLGLSGRLTEAGSDLGPYWQANFTLLAREAFKNTEFSASVFNLFDRRYNDPVGSDFPVDSVQQYGRSFRVKLTYRF